MFMRRLGLLLGLALASCASVPVVSVVPAPPRQQCGQSVLVIGAVATPGRYTVGEAPTLLKAIRCAGGFLPDAHRDSVVIERCANGRSEALRVVSSRVSPGGEGDVTLQEGDLIHVPTYD
jgi:protein involved in polysaccharide export with SLBB domain